MISQPQKNLAPRSKRSEAKARKEREAHADAINDALRNAPPGKILETLRSVRTPRESLLIQKALVAYEAAPLGKESGAVVRVLGRFRNLTSSEVLTVKGAIPSPRVGDEVWRWFCVLKDAEAKAAEARREAEEQARRRRVVAAREKSKTPARPRKGGAA